MEFDDKYNDLDYLLSDIYDIESKIYRAELKCLKKGHNFVINALNQFNQEHDKFLQSYQGMLDLIGFIYKEERPPYFGKFLRDSFCCFSPKFFSDEIVEVSVYHQDFLWKKQIVLVGGNTPLDFNLSELMLLLISPEITVKIKLLYTGTLRSRQEQSEQIFNTSKYLNSILLKSFEEFQNQCHYLYFNNLKDHKNLIDFNQDYITNAYKIDTFKVTELRYVWQNLWNGCFFSSTEILNRSKQDCKLIEEAGQRYLHLLEKASSQDLPNTTVLDKMFFIWNNVKKSLSSSEINR